MNPANAPHLALLIFLFFFALHTALAALGFAGMEWLASAAPAALLQALVCLAAVVALAARLALAPTFALTAGLLVTAVPLLFGALGATLQSRKAYSAAHRHYVETLLDTKRHASGGTTLAEQLAPLGYEAPPEIKALRERERARVRTWLSSSAAARAHDEAGKAVRYAPLPGVSFQQDLFNNLEKATGSNWSYINLFLSSAARNGLKLDEELSPEDRASAEAAVGAWLDENWAAVERALRPPVDEDDVPGSGPKPQYLVVLVFLGALAAWIGREAFDRPLDLARLPAWSLEGLRAMLRRDPTAGLRVALGLALLLGAAGLVVLLYMAGVRLDKSVARIVATVLLMGALLAFSGLALSGDGRIDPPRLS